MRRRHGYDFGQYAPASLLRRVRQLAKRHGDGDGAISTLIHRVLHEPELLPQLLEGLSVPASDMFRDPSVFRALREQVLPQLATHPQITIWQAGCARGEEVYSLAILLEEAGLYERSQIFATDLSELMLEQAREGIYPLRAAQQWSRNYVAAGGSHSLADYCSARYGLLKLDRRLRRNVTFAQHNLVADEVFCEAQLVLCRNVLIYFSNPLQQRCLARFRDSLVRGGFLCLGLRERPGSSGAAADFTPVDANLRIYRRAAAAGPGP
ncbi:protein-glutamate O-methyltransferase CheR [Rhodanobacter sp. DHB23]|nr:CheR family methyltransferase [Rhodanobacter sp. DHB23]MBD8873238.1 protein-glutamate O-methyltransferase CheR [Rhodanobacter sp. DHB23]